ESFSLGGKQHQSRAPIGGSQQTPVEEWEYPDVLVESHRIDHRLLAPGEGPPDANEQQIVTHLPNERERCQQELDPLSRNRAANMQEGGRLAAKHLRERLIRLRIRPGAESGGYTVVHHKETVCRDKLQRLQGPLRLVAHAGNGSRLAQSCDGPSD